MVEDIPVYRSPQKRSPEDHQREYLSLAAMLLLASWRQERLLLTGFKKMPREKVVVACIVLAASGRPVDRPAGLLCLACRKNVLTVLEKPECIFVDRKILKDAVMLKENGFTQQPLLGALRLVPMVTDANRWDSWLLDGCTREEIHRCWHLIGEAFKPATQPLFLQKIRDFCLAGECIEMRRAKNSINGVPLVATSEVKHSVPRDAYMSLRVAIKSSFRTAAGAAPKGL